MGSRSADMARELHEMREAVKKLEERVAAEPEWSRLLPPLEEHKARVAEDARALGVDAKLREIVDRRRGEVEADTPEGFLAEHREHLEDISSIVAALADRTAVVAARVFGHDSEPGAEAGAIPTPQAAAESLHAVRRRIRDQLEELEHQIDRLEAL